VICSGWCVWVSNSVPIINGNEKRREKCTYPCTYPGTRELSSCDQAHHGSFKHACQILMRLSRFLMFKTSSVLIEFKQSISAYPRVCLYIGLSICLDLPHLQILPALPLRREGTQKRIAIFIPCSCSCHADTRPENAHHGIVVVVIVRMLRFIAAAAINAACSSSIQAHSGLRQYAIIADALDAPATHCCPCVPPKPFAIRP
jgi:hypothetical protein